MLQSFKMALKSIWGNKMRSFLTMLGIIIGVASVIILVSLVNGQMSYMTEQFTSMGTNQINVNVTNLSSRTVTVDQMYQFYEDNKNLFSQMTPRVSVSSTLKNGTESLTNTTVSGVSEEYLEMKDQTLDSGRFLQYSDIISRQKVCVVGYYVAWELYGGAEKAIGQTIKINGYAYQIVGVVSRQDEDELKDGGSDDVLYLPYSSAAKMNNTADINSYIFATADMDHSAEAKEAINTFLYGTFKDEDLYRITAMSELLNSLNSMMSMMSMMLGGIAGISLLVAGVGVMNIMLVSVTERTREIGIRKALGAKKRNIMQQFVIEAAVTSSLGGVVGILVGSVATTIIGTAMGMNATPTPSAVMVSFSVSVGIGLLFGYMPARRAADLNPIDALRSE
ncbi:ABC transporter permease [Lacrimispora sp.]|uniref:ABC transporter permease n=1 Tax=Lacrimispora sp. TaxID=2719234 RepID=UPI0028AA3D6B|nr:ABC transporter permease [Lacrimispora sp.]